MSSSPAAVCRRRLKKLTPGRREPAFDGAGHDLQAGHHTALAITAIRLARRQGVADLTALAAHADDLLTAQPGPTRFVTAALAT
jgi:hypothetical protein